MRVFFSVEDTRERLASAGYLADEITATVVYLASKLNKPILLEGPPGAGKTELACAIASAVGTCLERLQCYPGIDDEKAIGRFDEPMQRLWVEMRAKSGTPIHWDDLRAELHESRFFTPGPLLRVLQYPIRCVLLIDEVDKVDESFESMLLELLSVWQLSIPKLGTISAKAVPIVLITSNQERRIGDLWHRLYDAVGHMAERLKAYKETENGVEHPFRDTMVTNLERLVDVLPRLNVTEDKELDRLAEEVRNSLLVDPQKLRDFESIRSQTANAADAIVQQMKSYMGGYSTPRQLTVATL